MMDDTQDKKTEQREDAQKKIFGTKRAWVVTIISIIMCTSSVIYISNIIDMLPWHISIVPYSGFMLMCLLVVTFLIHPIKKNIINKEALPWYDLLFIIMSILGGGYIAFFSKWWTVSLNYSRLTTIEIVFCAMLVISILEATRRNMGKTMPLVAALFILYLLFGYKLPKGIMGPRLSLGWIAAQFYLNPDGIFGVPVTVAFTIIIVFMLLAAFLMKSDSGKFLVDAAFAISGRWTGGPAKAAIVSSALLGTMTGVGPANVVTTGSITIPLMKSVGYRPEFAGAVEAVASNGGAIMPPVMALVAFMITEFLGMPYWSVCVASFLPAILYYIGIFTQVHLEAKKMNLCRLSSEQLPPFNKVMREGWFYLLPVVLLIYFLAIRRLPVGDAGLYTIALLISIIMINWQVKKSTNKSLKEIGVWFVEVMKSGIEMLITPGLACASAGIIIGSVTVSGFGYRLSNTIVNLAGPNMFILLLITAFSSFILGMGMTSVPCYLILVVLVAPALVKLGVLPIAAHLFVFYWGTLSFITPPVAITSFVAAGIAEADPFKTGFQAMRLAIVAYIVPFIFVYNPALLLIGTTGEIVIAAITSIIGVIFLSSAVEGYLLKSLNMFQRMFFLIGSILMIVPGTKTDIFGIIIIIMALLWHIRFIKKSNSNTKYKLLISV